MKTSEQTDKIFPALIAARKSAAAVPKSGNNTFDNYRYALLADYIDVMEGPLADNGLAVLSSVDEVLPIDGRVSKKNEPQAACYVKMTLRIVHDSGQWIEVGGVGEGQDRSDKATYKAITGARKYAIASAFNLITDDDPERGGKGDNANQTPAPKAKPADTASLKKLRQLITQAEIPDDLVATWLGKAGAHRLDDLTREQVDKCILFAQKKLMPAA